MSYQDDLNTLDEGTYGEFGFDALWNDVPVRVQKSDVTATGEFGESNVVADVLEIRVRKLEVAQARKGDLVQLMGDTYVIYERPETFGSGTQWRCFGEKAL